MNLRLGHLAAFTGIALLAFGSPAAGVVFPGLPEHPASGERIPGVLIVKFKEGARPANIKSHPAGAYTGIPSVDGLNTKYALQDYRPLFPPAPAIKPPRQAPDMSGFYVLTFDPDVALDRVAPEYLADPNVESVEYDYYAYIMRTPNDPQFAQQWDLYQESGPHIDAMEAWNRTVGAPATILADTDTGVLWYHEDLIDNIWVNPGEDIDHDGVVMDAGDMNGIDDDNNGYVDDLIGWDFVSGGSAVWPGEDGSVQDNDPKDFNGHGTHTSGTIAATTNNGKGVAGIAGGFGPLSERGCKIMCLRMGYSFNDNGQENGRTHMSYVSEAFYYAANNGAVAINYSFGSSPGGGIEAATDYAVAKGLVISAAAGNDNGPVTGYLQMRPDVMCVASTNQVDQRSSFSSYGPEVDVSAPGSAIRSTVSNHYAAGYATYQGTSMAAPHVVGLVGLIRTLNPALTRQEVFDIITTSADNIDAINPNYVGKLGSGRINAFRALQNLASTNFAATPLIGLAPLSVQFQDSSVTPPISWLWDFGDGNSSAEQNPLHTYGPGLFAVSLRIQTAIGPGSKQKFNYVTALAETLTTATVYSPPGRVISADVWAVNFQPVTEIILPVRVSGIPAQGSLDSIVATGCRTSYFEYTQVAYDNSPSGQMCFRLRANNGGNAQPLPPGSGPVAKVWLTIRSDADLSVPLVIDTATLGSRPYVLEFRSPVLSYVPEYHLGTVELRLPPGDLNSDGRLDILDVVAEVGVVFRGDALPPLGYIADINCDGTYNILDVVRLIDHVFRGGIAPSCA